MTNCQWTDWLEGRKKLYACFLRPAHGPDGRRWKRCVKCVGGPFLYVLFAHIPLHGHAFSGHISQRHPAITSSSRGGPSWAVFLCVARFRVRADNSCGAFPLYQINQTNYYANSCLLDI